MPATPAKSAPVSECVKVSDFSGETLAPDTNPLAEGANVPSRQFFSFLERSPQILFCIWRT